MLEDLSQDLPLTAGLAFLLGWLVAKIAGYVGRKFASGQRDPRDDRIRSLTADVRVAQSQTEKVKTQLEEAAQKLGDTQKILKVRDDVIHGQEGIIRRLKDDLKESVVKTRELRAELTERATENVRSEVKLREVETELSVAQASTDLLATGMLDYTTTDDDEEIPAFKAGR